jgi:hypothetical protein
MHEEKMPKATWASPRKKDHQYVPCPNIKPRFKKNATKS